MEPGSGAGRAPDRLPLAFRVARWWSRSGPRRGRWRVWELAARLCGRGRTVRAPLDFGAVALLDLSDPISRYPIAYGSMPEQSLARAVSAVLAEGDVFVDVGANFGYFSLLAATRVGGGGAVHAFEPQARPCELLRQSADLNGLENISVHQFALGDTEATATIHVPTHAQSGLATLRSEGYWLGGIAQRERQVRVRRLDDVLAAEGVGAVRAIKIDTEGYELPVLRGATRILTELRPVVFYEVQISRTDEDPSVASFLAEHDYRTFALTDAGAVPVDPTATVREQHNGCALIPGTHPDGDDLLAGDR